MEEITIKIKIFGLYSIIIGIILLVVWCCNLITWQGMWVPETFFGKIIISIFSPQSFFNYIFVPFALIHSGRGILELRQSSRQMLLNTSILAVAVGIFYMAFIVIEVIDPTQSRIRKFDWNHDFIFFLIVSIIFLLLLPNIIFFTRPKVKEQFK